MDRRLDRLNALPEDRKHDLVEEILREAGLEVYDPSMEASFQAPTRDVVFATMDGDYLSLGSIIAEWEHFGVYDISYAEPHKTGSGLCRNGVSLLLPVNDPEAADRAKQIMWVESEGRLLVFGGVKDDALQLFIS